jgi:hypothetical protein
MRELGTFVVVYPCWALVRKDSFTRDEAGKITGYAATVKALVLDDQAGGTTVPIFSDGDLAARFKKDSGGFDDFLTLKVLTPEMLVSILKQNCGVADAMSFDQPKMRSKPFAIWPLEHAIQKLEDGEML